MQESIPIAARLFMCWKVGNSHSTKSTILGYTPNFEPAAAVLRGGSSPVRGDWRPPGLAAGNGRLERPGGFECGRRPAARPNLSELDKYSVEPGLLDCTMRKRSFSQRTRRLQ